MDPPPRVLTWGEASDVLQDRSGENTDICKLYRAIFSVRQTAPSPSEAISLLSQTIRRQKQTIASGPDGGEKRCRFVFDSILFRHECCYLLGQLGADCEDNHARKEVYDCLYDVLCNENEDEVTRHEAAEGIAAVYRPGISSNDDLPVDFVDSNVFKTLLRLSQEGKGRGPLAETCYLAVEGIQRRGVSRVCACQYDSHDPALGDPSATASDIPRYAQALERQDAELFERYVAMFTLRNLGASDVLAQTLQSDRSSCVLRHEVAFVLGQMENEVGVNALISSLRDETEHAMVRHEAAIALGSIGGEPAKESLQAYTDHKEPMVAESCRVGLDTAAYWEAWQKLEERLRESGS